MYHLNIKKWCLAGRDDESVKQVSCRMMESAGTTRNINLVKVKKKENKFVEKKS